MKTLLIENFARIRRAEITFGDLTVFVGPQATGKTLVLELIKLIKDRPRIMNNLRKHGFEWKNPEEFLSLFFGEGMSIVWHKNKTRIIADNSEFHLNGRAQKNPEKALISLERL